MSKRTITVDIEIEQSFIPSPDKRAVAEVHTFIGENRVSALKIHQSAPGEYFVTGVLGADHDRIEQVLQADRRFSGVQFDSEIMQFCAYVSGWTNATALAEEVAATDVRLRAASG